MTRLTLAGDASAQDDGDLRTRASAILDGHLVEYRMASRRLEVLARSTHPRDEEASDALVVQQQARVSSACAVQADTLEGVLSKLDLWFADHLADGRDEPECEAERLAASARADLRQLLRTRAQP